MGSIKDEIGHEFDEAERITKLLKRTKPESDDFRKRELENEQKEIEIMDEEFMRGQQIDYDNMQMDEKAMKLDMQEIERIYGEHKAQKDSFYKRRETKAKLRSQGGVKKQSPIWDDED